MQLRTGSAGFVAVATGNGWMVDGRQTSGAVGELLTNWGEGVVADVLVDWCVSVRRRRIAAVCCSVASWLCCVCGFFISACWCWFKLIDFF